MAPFYPTLVSDCLVDTVNFYEDYFGFEAVIEQDGYVLLRHANHADVCIAVFDSKHDCVSKLVTSAQGVIVNIIDDDVKAKYDDLYMEGLDFYKEYGRDINGKEHFVVYDPNGTLLNVHAPLNTDDQIEAKDVSLVPA